MCELYCELSLLEGLCFKAWENNNFILLTDILHPDILPA